ncbi:hypothetical protein Hanom_Chr02g00146291 [Helianthus anomalus]
MPIWRGRPMVYMDVYEEIHTQNILWEKGRGSCKKCSECEKCEKCIITLYIILYNTI